MSLGEMIRAAMDARGMTAAQLASAVGLRRSITVYEWTGGHSTPNPERLGRVCAVLGLDPYAAARAAYPEVWAPEGEG